MKKGIVYYTNNNCNDIIFNAVIKRLSNICKKNNIDVVSVSHRPIDFGKNIIMDLPSRAESIFTQIYEGLLASEADVIYLAEHDVLYHPSHFDFVPINKRVFYYNRNVWQVDYNTGEAVYKLSRRTSQLVADKNELIIYFEKLLEIIKERGYSYKMGVSPRMHNIKGINNRGVVTFMSAFPNIDVRHGNNFSPYKYNKEKEIKANGVPNWGITLNNFNKYLI